MTKLFHRRRFLAGAAGATLALPFLERLHGAAQLGTGPTLRRIVTVTYEMGTVTEHFRPPSSGPLAGQTLPFVSAPLEPWKDRCTFVTRCDNAVLRECSQFTHGHPGKQGGALTGTLPTSAFRGDGTNRIENVIADATGLDEFAGANGESVCHFVGQRIRQLHHAFPSIDLGVCGYAGNPYDDRDLQGSLFHFEGPSNPVSLQLNPTRAFNRIFTGVDTGGGVDPELTAHQRRRRSVLDAVRSSFVELESGLGAADRRRLRDHAERIRQIELDIERVACAPPSGIARDGSTTSPWTPYIGANMSTLSSQMMPILASAMGCDLAPVGRLDFPDGHNPQFGSAGVDDELARWFAVDPESGWHGMVHGVPSPLDGVTTRPERGSGSGGVYSPALLDGYRFYVQQFANLLDALDAIPEGPDGASVLDHSLVVLASDFGDGEGHGPNGMCYVLAGNTGGAARLGWHIDCESTYHVNHLLTSIVRMFGIRDESGALVDSFGLGGFSTGVIPSLFA